MYTSCQKVHIYESCLYHPINFLYLH
ncbi:TPA: hypothetical protein QC057_004200 [Bacillus cereus]|nr:hypothetical protein [Bacillus cereus]